MPKKLTSLLTRACENFPGNVTFFEKDGFCQKPAEDCQYCKSCGNQGQYSCNKKTYTFTLAGFASA